MTAHDSAIAKIAEALYELDRKTVGGRPAWKKLRDGEAYDAGMKAHAVEQAKSLVRRAGGPSPVAMVVIDENQNHTWLTTDGVRLLIVDQNAESEPVYEITDARITHEFVDQTIAALGDKVAKKFDGKHPLWAYGKGGL